METAKTSKWTISKRLLKVLFLVVLTIILLAGIGLLSAQYLPEANIQAWFQQTLGFWFGVRMVLYVGILGLMRAIAQKKPEAMPQTAQWLIVGILVFAEAICQITLA